MQAKAGRLNLKFERKMYIVFIWNSDIFFGKKNSLVSERAKLKCGRRVRRFSEVSIEINHMVNMTSVSIPSSSLLCLIFCFSVPTSASSYIFIILALSKDLLFCLISGEWKNLNNLPLKRKVGKDEISEKWDPRADTYYIIWLGVFFLSPWNCKHKIMKVYYE